MAESSSISPIYCTLASHSPSDDNSILPFFFAIHKVAAVNIFAQRILRTSILQLSKARNNMTLGVSGILFPIISWSFLFTCFQNVFILLPLHQICIKSASFSWHLQHFPCHRGNIFFSLLGVKYHLLNILYLFSSHCLKMIDWTTSTYTTCHLKTIHPNLSPNLI